MADSKKKTHKLSAEQIAELGAVLAKLHTRPDSLKFSEACGNFRSKGSGLDTTQLPSWKPNAIAVSKYASNWSISFSSWNMVMDTIYSLNKQKWKLDETAAEDWKGHMQKRYRTVCCVKATNSCKP